MRRPTAAQAEPEGPAGAGAAVAHAGARAAHRLAPVDSRARAPEVRRSLARVAAAAGAGRRATPTPAAPAGAVAAAAGEAAAAAVPGERRPTAAAPPSTRIWPEPAPRASPCA